MNAQVIWSTNSNNLKIKVMPKRFQFRSTSVLIYLSIRNVSSLSTLQIFTIVDNWLSVYQRENKIEKSCLKQNEAKSEDTPLQHEEMEECWYILAFLYSWIPYPCKYFQDHTLLLVQFLRACESSIKNYRQDLLLKAIILK